MEADFPWHRQTLLWCFWAAGFFQVTGGARCCFTGVWHFPTMGAASWPLGDKGALPQGSQNWQDCPTMEADFPWPGRACSGISGLQSSSRCLAVLGADSQECGTS